MRSLDTYTHATWRRLTSPPKPSRRTMPLSLEDHDGEQIIEQIFMEKIASHWWAAYYRLAN
jgi:hypothetical protein